MDLMIESFSFCIGSLGTLRLSYPNYSGPSVGKTASAAISDGLEAVKILESSKETTMQSLQLHLSDAARPWLSKLPKGSIGSWSELTMQFTSNFRYTYKWPASIEEVKA
jgi:hypothetical protein